MAAPVITAPKSWLIKWISEVTLAHFYKPKRRVVQVYRVAFFASFLFDKRNENSFGYMAKNFAYTKKV